MVRSSPGWVHFKIKEGKFVSFNGNNREIYVNREWYQSTRLRQGLSCNQNLDLRLLGDHLSPKAKKRRENWGDKVFQVELNPGKTPSVRRQVDWFFFDGTANVDSSYPYLHEIRTCVVRLSDLYDAIPGDNEHTTGDLLAPQFVWHELSKLEELVILVGEYRKGVQPEDMIEIGSFQINDIPDDGDNDDDYISKLDKIENPNSKDLNVFRSDNYMMEVISAHLMRREQQRRMIRRGFLDSLEGKQWLANGTPTWWLIFSKWVATQDGDNWLSSKGSEFLSSTTGHWWLSSEYGHPWLETESGIWWLGTQNAETFLDSGWALVWAKTGARKPKSTRGMGRQVRKAWFDTAAGHEWKIAHCPNGNPPKQPVLELESGPRPQRLNNYPVAAFHRNFRFRGWRFVISPEDLVRGPKGRAIKPGRELGILRHLRG
ncbi:hypothetical protein F4820DRAFT_408945 [Hypoxylon rubiginosum]|uniref:Uncharacterized protein n=1 Tax=Hypoxylon rubiginosum TaxID=110542 RepID=A0ACB9ZB49_9PEZI|nr:hypothetical protein F4820DRAFT_408945 [Hypoxylon rubiginosum]